MGSSRLDGIGEQRGQRVVEHDYVPGANLAAQQLVPVVRHSERRLPFVDAQRTHHDTVATQRPQAI
jgi:hypothetical protein